MPEIPSLPDEAVHGSGRMDVSGRVGDRAVIRMLGWRPGDPLRLTAAAGVVIARRDPAGLVVMLAKPYIVIPAVLRRRCGLRPGDRVMLTVFPGEDALAAHSFAVVDQALRAHAALAHCAAVPTFADYVPVVSATVSPGPAGRTTRTGTGQLMTWLKTKVVTR